MYQAMIDKRQEDLEKEVIIPILADFVFTAVTFTVKPILFKKIFMNFIKKISFNLRVLSYKIIRKNTIDLFAAVKLFKPQKVLVLQSETLFIPCELEKIIGKEVFIKSSQETYTLGKNVAIKFPEAFNKYLRIGDEIIIQTKSTDGLTLYNKVKIAGVTNGEVLTKCTKAGLPGKTYSLNGLDYYYINNSPTEILHTVPYFSPRSVF